MITECEECNKKALLELDTMADSASLPPVLAPVVRLTRPEVLELLKQIQFVAHTIVPEKYRFWKSNQTGVCPRPMAITSGPQGTILVLDYDFESSTAKLVSARLHQPADVSVKKEGYKDARDICYNNGIAFVPERGSGVISFVVFGGCVTVKVDALKKASGCNKLT